MHSRPALGIVDTISKPLLDLCRRLKQSRFRHFFYASPMEDCSPFTGKISSSSLTVSAVNHDSASTRASTYQCCSAGDVCCIILAFVSLSKRYCIAGRTGYSENRLKVGIERTRLGLDRSEGRIKISRVNLPSLPALQLVQERVRLPRQSMRRPRLRGGQIPKPGSKEGNR